jgi:hypothetical protein
VSGLAAARPQHEAAEPRPLREHPLEMVVGLIGGLVAVLTALFRAQR